MFDTFEEVKQNPYINNFPQISKDFGLYGRYVEYKGDVNTDYNGIYFIYGFDKEKVYGRVDLHDIVEQRAKDRNFMHYGCFASKISDCDPFAVHQNVVDNCRHAEFIKKIYEEYHLPLPPKVSVNSLLTIKMLYVNSRNPQLSASTRENYENSLKKMIKFEDSLHNPQNPNYHKDDFIKAGYYDTSKGKIYNLGKKIFSKDHNKVSLEHLISECITISKYRLSVNMSKLIQKELRKHPEILYWMSEPIGKIFDVPEGQGYGPKKENNDIRTVIFAFDEAYYNDVVKIINKLNYPEGFGLSYESMAKTDEPLFIIGIDKQDYSNFSELCFSNDVPYCIDNDIKKQNGDILNIVIRKQDLDMVGAILQRLCEESEQFHISIPRPENTGLGDLPTISMSQVQRYMKEKNMTQEEKTISRIKEKYGGGDWVMISNTFTDER